MDGSTYGNGWYRWDGEWGSRYLRRARTGFIVEIRNRVQGQMTDAKYLLPYDKLPYGYGKDSDLKAPHNDAMTVGQFLAELPSLEFPYRVLRRGHVVQ